MRDSGINIVKRQPKKPGVGRRAAIPSRQVWPVVQLKYQPGGGSAALEPCRNFLGAWYPIRPDAHSRHQRRFLSDRKFKVAMAPYP
jgi:hypothetical protein